MAKKTKSNLTYNKEVSNILLDIVDSVQFLTPGDNTLPTSDPASAGALFITGSTGANLGGLTGSGAYLLMVSQG